MQLVSIIIPALNEANNIENTLANIEKMVQQGHECIVVDGGSTDDTLSICSQYNVTCLKSEKGRAVQMNYGAAHAKNNILVFLHADTLLPYNAIAIINKCISAKHSKYLWGRFNVKFTGQRFILRIIEFFMNLRSCITGIATGDQVVFIEKELFEKVNGFKQIPLMEDIEISKALKKYSRPICIKNKVITSSRRWELNGYWKTITLMWKIRLLYFFGVPADKLVKMYY